MTKNARDFEIFHLKSNKEQCLNENQVYFFDNTKKSRDFLTDKEGV